MPSQNGDNGTGRDPRTGQFVRGNTLGRGNPRARQVGELRSAMLAAVSPGDVDQVVKVLLKKAKSGSIPAIKELLDRVVGRPLATHEISAAPSAETTKRVIDSLNQALGMPGPGESPDAPRLP